MRLEAAVPPELLIPQVPAGDDQLSVPPADVVAGLTHGLEADRSLAPEALHQLKDVALQGEDALQVAAGHVLVPVGAGKSLGLDLEEREGRNRENTTTNLLPFNFPKMLSWESKLHPLFRSLLLLLMYV